jgi:hypothetical protein
MKLMVSDYEVTMASQDSNSEFFVKFIGPKDSPYEEVSISCFKVAITCRGSLATVSLLSHA